jgi:PadR family transcriptional regulator, regulatory protein AphA
MSLDHAILGFLNYSPLSGYDLKKVFDNSVQHFWPADQSQIYRTLTRLTEQGWAEMEVVEQTERPDRKVYHITEAGRGELLNWLAGPTPKQVSRSAALVQVFFVGQMTDEVILGKFETYAQTVRAVLERYEQLQGELTANMPENCTPREQYFWLSTLDLGIRTMNANLEWAENIIENLKNGKVPKK